jgi:hypothetical protein
MDATHRRFAVECFNAAWELLEKEERTPGETDTLIDIAHASRWHWTQTSFCTPENLAIGAWLLSRVYVVADCADLGLQHGEVSLQICQEHGLAPFYEAYAYEALARAAAAHGEDPGRYLAEARRLAERVDDPEERQALLTDLESIRERGSR